MSGMKSSSVAALVQSMNDHQVQYVIAGGLAVVAHGHVRFTADVDILLILRPENLTRAIAAFESLEYKPRAPVPIAELLDPAARRRWKSEKNMIVFSLSSARHPLTEVDLFIDPPLDVAAAVGRAVQFEIAKGVTAPICALDDLIHLKKLSGRPLDLQDIAALKKIRKTGPA